jgi:hypothetical protein
MSAQPSHLDKLRALGLPVLQLGSVTAYHSRDRQSRAEKLTAVLADEARFYELDGASSLETNVAVLDEADWRATFELPYGLAAYRSDGAVIFLPADVQRGAIFKDLLAASAASPSDVAEVADLIATHELGHAYERRHFGIGPPSQWFNELVAWYIGYGYLAACAPESLRKVLHLHRAVAETTRPTTRSLDEYERSTPTGREYARFQALFLARTRDVYAARGLQYLDDLAREFPKAATRDEERLSNAEILRRLERLSPGFERWARSVGDGPSRSSTE